MRSASWRRLTIAGGILALGAACSEGDSSSLQGLWGGADLQLAAGGDSVQLRMPCMIFTARGPIRVNDDGTFELAGTNEPRVDLAGGAYPIHLNGRISGALLQASYYTGVPSSEPTTTFDVQLIRGQQGSYPDQLCIE